MRDYELTLLVDPGLEEKKQKVIIDGIKKLIEKAKGKIKKEEVWGKKKLSYPIKKKKEGFYYFYLLSLPVASLPEIEKKLKLEEGILRFLTIKKE